MAIATDKRTIHLSKSSITTWEQCRLRYRFDRIDRLQGDGEEPGRAQLVGTAAHEAVAAAITTPASSGYAADAVLDGYALTENDRDAARCWATDAARLAADRGGEPRWVEQLLAMERIPGRAARACGPAGGRANRPPASRWLTAATARRKAVPRQGSISCPLATSR